MEIHLYNVESAYLPLTDAESSRNNVKMALKLKFSYVALLLLSLLDRLFYIIYVDKHLLLIG